MEKRCNCKRANAQMNKVLAPNNMLLKPVLVPMSFLKDEVLADLKNYIASGVTWDSGRERNTVKKTKHRGTRCKERDFPQNSSGGQKVTEHGDGGDWKEEGGHILYCIICVCIVSGRPHTCLRLTKFQTILLVHTNVAKQDICWRRVRKQWNRAQISRWQFLDIFDFRWLWIVKQLKMPFFLCVVTNFAVSIVN